MTPPQQFQSVPATKEDIRESETHLHRRIDELRDTTNTRIDELRDTTNARIDATNSRIDELRDDMENIRRDLKVDLRMYFGATMGLVGILVSAVVGILVAVAL